MYIQLLKKCVLDSIYGSNMITPDGKGEEVMKGKADQESILNGTYWPSRAHTMIGEKRLTNIEKCFLDILENKIEGDIIETGVWRGGSCIFMAGLNKYYKSGKKVFVADSFEGLPPPNEKKYPLDKGDILYKYKSLAVSLEDVKSNFSKYDLLDENVIFIKGFFNESLKNAPIEKLSLLRLDGDMYESTMDSLIHLYDKVVVGGYIIIDDYGCIPACAAAVEDFRKSRGITTKLETIDWTGRYWKKE